MEKDLEQRTKAFSLAAIGFVANHSSTANTLAKQLLRCATSIGANHREANCGVSRADFANKIGTVQKEAAETQYWIELLIESRLVDWRQHCRPFEGGVVAISDFRATGKRLKDSGSDR